MPKGFENKKTTNRSLMRFMERDDFKLDLNRLKLSIAMGKTLEEARVNLRITSLPKWRALMEALGRMEISRERIYLEFHTRTQTRYQQISEMMQRHGPYLVDRATGKYKEDINGTRVKNPDADSEMESRMLLMLCKLDEQVVELADKMGLLKKSKDDDTGGEGFTDEQVREELERVTRVLETQIRGEREALEPLYLGSQSHTEAGGQTDIMGAPAMDANDPERQ